MSGAKRVSSEEVSRRVDQVIKYIYDGMDDRDLSRQMSLEWGITIRQAQRYKKKAYEILKVESDRNRTQLVNIMAGRLDRLYIRALKQGNLNVALGVVKEFNELFGLKTLNVKHSGAITLSELFEDEDN